MMQAISQPADQTAVLRDDHILMTELRSTDLTQRQETVLNRPGETNSTGHRRHAILTLLAATSCTFTGCGLNFAFGVFQDAYETEGGPFLNASPAKIDLIGTLGVSVMTLGAPWATSWTSRYGPAAVTATGSILFGLGMALASFGTQLWHFHLTQGLLLGLGTCLSYIPAVTVTPGWYDRRRGLAMGIVLSGTGIGGLVWAPITRTLISTLGFRNALRIEGGIGFILIATAATVLRWDPEALSLRSTATTNATNTTRFSIPMISWRVVKSRVVVAKSAAATLQSMAYYMPIYFISSYARRLRMTPQTGANLIAINNGLSALGKVVLGWAADRYGHLNVLWACTTMSALSVFCIWAPASTDAVSNELTKRVLFVAYVILYGITSGTYVSLLPPVLFDLVGPQYFSSVNGALYFVRGVGSLVGTPSTGALIQGGRRSSVASPEGFLHAIIMTGVLLAASAACVAWVRVEKSRRDGWKWKA